MEFDLCTSAGFLQALYILKNIFMIVMFLLPILVIISLTFEISKVVTDVSKIKDVIKASKNRLIAALIIVFLPTIINIVLSAMGNANRLSTCYNNAVPEKIAVVQEEEAQRYVDAARKALDSKECDMAQDAIKKIKDETERERLTKELNEACTIAVAYNSNPNLLNNKGWWWPVGSVKTEIKNGVTFAPGAPSATYLTAYFSGDDEVHKGLGGGHGAIDIGAYTNSNVIAAKAGVVIYPGPNDRIDYPDMAITPDKDGKYNCQGLKANYVLIQHEDGITTQYAHLHKNTITVRSGDTVAQGQVIGKSGSSGCSTGPHLHFEMKLNGTRVDPLKYVSATNPRP